ncbi:MAG: serine/threonine protein kinase [Deltaproteobacteria bacterium]|nr:MAG: serine/threonine protein kinase [Deltaproteobacteria bacterium]
MDKVEQIIICPACGHKNPAAAKFCQNDGYPLRDGNPDDPLVGRLVGNYRLLERKGEGGFGVVYLAEHNNLKTRFAVKILHPQFSANRHIAERFRREALAAGKMRHEHVVSIADFDQAPGVGLYYAMEYLEGKTLKSSLDDGEEFGPSRILHVARQVTSAMERVHSLNIIHRDLKPENIFLLEEGGVNDYVKLVDFGIAKLMDEEGASLTRTGLSVGTPLYMSPEQARGNLKALGPRSDIYSWGVILFEMMTYRPPFFSENPHEVVMMQIREMPPRLSEVCPDRVYSPDIEDFMRRVLAKDPNDRPPTMLKMYEELEDILSAPDVMQDTGLTQVVEQREEWANSNTVHVSTPTATQTTREVLEEEAGKSLVESTGEHLQPAHVTSEEFMDPSQTGEELREDTPDWRNVFPDNNLDDEELSDTISGKNMDEALAEAAKAGSSSPAVDVNFVSGDDLPLPPMIGQASTLPPPPLVDEGEVSPSGKVSDTISPETQESHNTEELSPEAIRYAKQAAFQMAPPADDDAKSDSDSEEGKTFTSFSTDPNALRSPLQRYGTLIVVGVFVFVGIIAGLIYWLRTSEPEPSIDYNTLMRRVKKQPNVGAGRPSSRRPRIILLRPNVPKKRKVDARSKKQDSGIPFASLATQHQVSLSIRVKPEGASCEVHLDDEWEEMTHCSLWQEVGEPLEVRIVKSGFVTEKRTWLRKQSRSWTVELRKVRKKRSRRRRVRVRRVSRRSKVKKRTAPERRRAPATRGDSIFEQTDNPFRDKSGKK